MYWSANMKKNNKHDKKALELKLARIRRLTTPELDQVVGGAISKTTTDPCFEGCTKTAG